MFGIGTTELIIILLVALIVLGPTKLPGIARSLGKALGEFRRVTTDVQRTLNLEAARIEEDEREKKKSPPPSDKVPDAPKPIQKSADQVHSIPPPQCVDPNPYDKHETAKDDSPPDSQTAFDTKAQPQTLDVSASAVAESPPITSSATDGEKAEVEPTESETTRAEDKA